MSTKGEARGGGRKEEGVSRNPLCFLLNFPVNLKLLKNNDDDDDDDNHNDTVY